MKEIVDTNVILRFLVKDQAEHFKQAEAWFREAETGKRELWIEPIVVAEACFVLESFYKLSRDEIGRSMRVLLSQRWLNVAERETLLGLWQWYLGGLHFVDSYLIAWSHVHEGSLLTFDQKAARRART